MYINIFLSKINKPNDEILKRLKGDEFIRNKKRNKFFSVSVKLVLIRNSLLYFSFSSLVCLI